MSIVLTNSLIDFYLSRNVCNIERTESAGHDSNSCVKAPGTYSSSADTADTTSAASCKAAAGAGAAAALAAAAANFA